MRSFGLCASRVKGEYDRTAAKLFESARLLLRIADPKVRRGTAGGKGRHGISGGL